MKKTPGNQAYQLLEESKARYDLLIESVKDYAIFMLDPNGIVTSWNKGAQHILGYSPEEIIGKSFVAFYLAEGKGNHKAEHEMSMAKSMGKFEEEGWRVRKDNTPFWANATLTPIYNNNIFLGFSQIIRDLTQKKVLEDELKASEEQSRLLIEGVKDYAIFMLNPEGFIATWNMGAERLKGYKKEEIIGKHFSTFYTQEAIDGHFPQYELAMAIEEGRFEDEGWRIRKDGTVFWANVVITALFNAENKHIGFTKITRDITNHVKNEELMKKNKTLHKINTDLDNFIYTASHDLKSPIANLEGLIGLLSKKVSNRLEQNEKKILQMMKTSIEKLRQTIDDLKEITKAQKGLDDQLEEVFFKDILDEVKADIGAAINKANARVIEKFEVKGVPYAKANLRTVLYNLITNAVKYRSPDRGLMITVESYYTEEDIVLSVSDNGLGLNENQVSKLFTMFKRFHAHTEGTGIGLYIIKRIVENGGGRIAVDSEENKGTTFKIFFPRQG